MDFSKIEYVPTEFQLTIIKCLKRIEINKLKFENLILINEELFANVFDVVIKKFDFSYTYKKMEFTISIYVYVYPNEAELNYMITLNDGRFSSKFFDLITDALSKQLISISKYLLEVLVKCSGVDKNKFKLGKKISDLESTD
ncbi:hypothetical protein LIT25_18645 [Bacillus sp. F19]|nr:hypothetical protein LIT25_18645 [Bacillus sp. F19]